MGQSSESRETFIIKEDLLYGKNVFSFIDTFDCSGVFHSSEGCCKRHGSRLAQRAGESFESSDVFGTDGKLTITTNWKNTKTGKSVQVEQALAIGKTKDYYAVELTDPDDSSTKQAFAWATEDGGTIDMSSYAKGAIITGANNDDAADYIIGGSGSDSIAAGVNDSVYGGKGNDLIYVDDHAGVTVGLYNDGSTDSVVSANFNLGDGYDDEDNTTVYFDGNLANAKLSYDSATSTVTLVNGKSKLLISNEGMPNVKHADDDGKNYDTHKAVGLKVTNGTSTQNVEVLPATRQRAATAMSRMSSISTVAISRRSRQTRPA